MKFELGSVENIVGKGQNAGYQTTDDSFRFDENDRKSSKQEENTVGKGEIARNKQFLLFPQCFQKLVL